MKFYDPELEDYAVFSMTPLPSLSVKEQVLEIHFAGGYELAMNVDELCKFIDRLTLLKSFSEAALKEVPR